MSDVLDQRQLNRSLLSRQMLLERSTITAFEAISHSIGFQAQSPNSPYFAIWNRVNAFDQSELSQLFAERKVVRIALMRSTIFLVTASDCLDLRPLLQTAVHQTFLSGYAKRAAGLDLAAVAVAGRELVEERPHTFQELGERLGLVWPNHDRAVLAEVIRSLVPLVQVPPRGVWGSSGPAAHTSAEHWLGQPLSDLTSIDEMVVRYFAAFGPATIADLQHWSGIRRLREVVERNLGRLKRRVDSTGVERFDVTDAPAPHPETPAPVRFLGEFDNLLLSHANRTHIISDADRGRVFTNNGIIRSTILVDGFVRGLWKLQKSKTEAWLEVSPFRPLTAHERHDLEEEGTRLISFAAGEWNSLGVRFFEPE